MLRTDTRVHLLLEGAQEGLVLVQLGQADGAGHGAGLRAQALRLDGSDVHLLGRAQERGLGSNASQRWVVHSTALHGRHSRNVAFKLPSL